MDRTADFKAALSQRRSALGVKRREEDLMRAARQPSPFASQAEATLRSVGHMRDLLLSSREAYLLEDELRGMSEAQRDEIDAETTRFVNTCSQRIAALDAQLKTPPAGVSRFLFESADSPQRREHERAVVGLLYEGLKGVISIFDEHRGHRLRRAAEERDRRVGTAIARQVKSSQSAKEGSTGGSRGRRGTAAAIVGGGWRLLAGRTDAAAEEADADHSLDQFATGWAEEALVSEENLGLNEEERSQLLLENEALAKELECMVEQEHASLCSAVLVASASVKEGKRGAFPRLTRACRSGERGREVGARDLYALAPLLEQDNRESDQGQPELGFSRQAFS
ncbi:MAG: hypothetical protein SGPRY_002074 [Prymnesium sp.]